VNTGIVFNPAATTDAATMPNPTGNGAPSERDLAWQRAIQSAQEADLATLFQPWNRPDADLPVSLQPQASDTMMRQAAISIGLAPPSGARAAASPASAPEPAPAPQAVSEPHAVSEPPTVSGSTGPAPTSPNAAVAAFTHAPTGAQALPAAPSAAQGSVPSVAGAAAGATAAATTPQAATPAAPGNAGPRTSRPQITIGQPSPSGPAESPHGLDLSTDIVSALAASAPTALTAVASAAATLVTLPIAAAGSLQIASIGPAPALIGDRAAAEVPAEAPADGDEAGVEPETASERRAAPAADPAPRDPVRLYAEWSDQGVRVWLGTDAGQSWSASDLAQQIQHWLNAQGERLRALVWNGRPMSVGSQANAATPAGLSDPVAEAELSPVVPSRPGSGEA
jgi:hypothetical protein